MSISLHLPQPRHIFRSRAGRLKGGLLLLSALLALGAKAQGDLLVTPRRVIFEGGSRMRELNLANIGQDTARYIISVMEIRMKEDGSFEQISVPDSGQLFASGHLRIFPRSVTVPPGESQMVKVQLVKSDELTPGEYRSHVYVRAVPVQKPLADADTTRDSTEINVKLTAIFGISIPALIRLGENDTKVSLTEPSFTMMDGKTPHLSITLNRSGKMSSYGDLRIECIAANGTVKEVGLVKGLAVYTPNRKRRFQLDLDASGQIDYKKARLHITYKTQKDASIQDFSETELALQ